jgi:hypothetical protein
MKSPLKKIEGQLWQECRRLVLARDKNEDGTVDCFTCSAKNLIGSNCQLGHGPWPKDILNPFLKYDLRVLHYQCSRCNIWHGGMGGEYYKRLLKEKGTKWLAKLEKDREKVVDKLDFYTQLLKKYEFL